MVNRKTRLIIINIKSRPMTQKSKVPSLQPNLLNVSPIINKNSDIPLTVTINVSNENGANPKKTNPKLNMVIFESI